MTPFERVLEALEKQDLIQPSWGGGIAARCPAHDDNRASLSVSEGDDGKVLLFDHAGCDVRDVTEGLGLQLTDLFPAAEANDRIIVAQYEYVDENGDPLIRVTRTDPKGFFQERWDAGEWKLGAKGVRKVLYNLPTVLGAIATGLPIYILEGEKDVHTFESVASGAVATCAIGGAGKWLPDYGDALAGGRVVVVPDRDDAGRHHASLVVEALAASADVSVVWPSAGNDFTDHVYGGGGLDDLLPHEPYDADWDDWQDDGIPQTDWLVPGILARGTLVWAYGAKETAKSMYFLAEAARLSHRDETVTYYSEEMSKATDRRRINRLSPNPENFRWKNGRGLDLAIEQQLEQVIQENRGTSLIILDSYERVFTPPTSNENKRAVLFARICHEIIVETGATVVVIDHTGFGYRDSEGTMHDERKPRGASAKEQQADMSILFSSLGVWTKGEDYYFTMENMKPGRLENPFKVKASVRDTLDGGLTVVLEKEPLLVEPVQDPTGGQESDGELRTAPEPTLDPLELYRRRLRAKGLSEQRADEEVALRRVKEMLL